MTIKPKPVLGGTGSGEKKKGSDKPPYSPKNPQRNRRHLARPAFSPVARLFRPLGTEESDTYPRVLAILNHRWRVIVCRQSIQWVLQKRRGSVDHWRGYWFCHTREALIRGAREHAGQVGGDALVVLLRLPERFPEAAP